MTGIFEMSCRMKVNFIFMGFANRIPQRIYRLSGKRGRACELVQTQRAGPKPALLFALMNGLMRTASYFVFLNIVNPCHRNSLTFPSGPRVNVIMSLPSDRSFQTTWNVS